MADPTAFISYSWDDDAHKTWVRDLAARLRGDGVAVSLDQWHAAPGDQLPEFMERSIRESAYVVVVCTPGYRKRSDERRGGVGYEGDVITGELLIQRNHRKFIPLLRSGDPGTALPSWLAGKYFVDLGGAPYPEPQYADLVTTILGVRPSAPPVGSRVVATRRPTTLAATPEEPIRITGIVADKVTMPKMDGTRGSALYQVPFRLSRRPDQQWSTFFIEAWNHPSSFSTMHRPGTADVEGDIVWLRRTTLEEVERYHRDTLLLAVNEANANHEHVINERRLERQRDEERARAHRIAIDDVAKRIKFD